MGSKEIIPTNKITEKMLPPHLRNKSRGRSNVASSFALSDYDFLVAGESISKGNAVHLTSDGLAYKADAENDKPAIAFALNDAIVNESVYIATSRQIQIPTANFTIGSDVFLSSGTINISTTIPTLVNNLIVQRIGLAISVDKVLIEIEKPRIAVI